MRQNFIAGTILYSTALYYSCYGVCTERLQFLWWL